MMKPSRNRKRQAVARQPALPLLQLPGIVSLALLLFFLPYRKALYNGGGTLFEMPQLAAAILTFTLLIGSIYYFYRKFQSDNLKSILVVWAMSIPLLYYIASLQGASAHGSAFMVLMNAMYAVYFILALYYGEGLSAQRLLASALTAAVYGIVLFGVLNMFGQVYYMDALWLTEGQYRLSSVFQYSNTYAGFLSAALVLCSYWILISKNLYIRLLHALMLVPISVSILLTLSRGALVILPLLVIIYLLFLRLRDQLFTLAVMGAALIATLAVISKISSLYNQIAVIVQPAADKDEAPISLLHPLALEGWTWLLAASAFAAATVYVCHRFVAPWLENKLRTESRLSSAWVPATVAGLGVLLVILLSLGSSIHRLFPDAIAQRLENINFRQHSVLERGTFYQDALKIVRDYPIIGTGGNGWTTLYEHYQNNPYTSTQTHSYPFQILVEIGVAGFVLFAGFLIFAYVVYIRHYFKTRAAGETTYHFLFFIFSLCLLIHSLIDFDMSYSYLCIVLFFCLGAMLAPLHRTLSMERLGRKAKQYIRIGLTAVVLVLSITLLSESVQAYNAQQNYRKSMVMLDKAIRSYPANPEFTLFKVGLLEQEYRRSNNADFLEQIGELLHQLERYEPYNQQLINAKYRHYKNIGDFDAAVDVLTDAVRKFPWNIQYYQGAIMEWAEAGIREAIYENTAEANRLWAQALSMNEEVLRQMEKLTLLPKEQLQGRIFNQTPYIRQAIGSIHYFQGDYAAALTLMEPLKQEDFSDPYIRSGIRYYLAALQASGQQDEELSDRLIAADPEERERLALLYERNAAQ